MANFTEKLHRTQEILSNNSSIGTFVEGSTAYQLAQSIAFESYNAEKKIEEDGLKRSLLDATGDDLDFLGINFFGVPRIRGRKPFVTPSMKSIRFYVSANRTFGEINLVADNSGNKIQSDIILLAGTVISGELNSQSIKFVIETSYILPASEKEIYVSGKLIQGPNGIISANILTSHNFGNYSDFLNNSLLVNNDSYILTGTEDESDDDYKFRLSQAKRTENPSNTDGVLQISRDVAGVSDTQVYQAKDGAGTCTIYVQGITPVTSDEAIGDVNMALLQHSCPPWAEIAVVKRDYLGLEISLTISLVSSANISDTNMYIENITNNIKSYINNFVSDKFYFEDLKRKIEDYDQNISSVTFDTINLYRGEEPFRESYLINISSTPFLNILETEKIIVEQLQSPILVSIN